MAVQFTAWKDSRGGVHDTAEKADAADLNYRRFRSAYDLLNDGGNPIIRFASTAECAGWIADNWPALKKAMGED